MRAKLRGLRQALFLEVDTNSSLAERMAQANCQEFDLGWAGNSFPSLLRPLPAIKSTENIVHKLARG